MVCREFDGNWSGVKDTMTLVMVSYYKTKRLIGSCAKLFSVDWREMQAGLLSGNAYRNTVTTDFFQQGCSRNIG